MLAVLFGLHQAFSDKNDALLTVVGAFPVQSPDHTIGILPAVLGDTAMAATGALASLKTRQVAPAGCCRYTSRILATKMTACSG